MNNNLLEKITVNYNEQHDLYMEMARLANEQLECLENGDDANSAKLWALLESRKQLMDAILQLNEKAQQIQKECMTKYSIEQFTLSNLQGKVDALRYEELKNAIDKMGAILHEINNTDAKNQAIMRQKTINRNSVQTSNNIANQAYRQAMQQKKQG